MIVPLQISFSATIASRKVVSACCNLAAVFRWGLSLGASPFKSISSQPKTNPKPYPISNKVVNRVSKSVATVLFSYWICGRYWTDEFPIDFAAGSCCSGVINFGLASVGAGIVRPCGWVFIGLVWSNLFAVWSLHHRPAEYWFLDQIQLSGSIPEQSKISDDFVRFNLEVESVNNQRISEFGSPKVRLSWFDDYQVPKKGDKWRFTVKLRRPRGYWNTGVFDYEKYLFLEDITGLGYVVSGERIQPGRGTDLSVKMRFSKRVNASFTLLYPDLILALAVGDRGLITADR